MTPSKDTPELQVEFKIPAELNFQEVLTKAREYFYKLDPNIIGITIGPRRVKHSGRPGEFALVVYVAKKKPLSELDPAKVIPREFMGLGTDVYAPRSDDAPLRTGDLVKDFVISVDMSAIDPVRINELAVMALPTARVSAPNVRDFGDVCVIENDGRLVFPPNAPNGNLDYVHAYNLFRTLHDDKYEFVTFFVDENSGMPNPDADAYFSVFNDVRGIGREPLERPAAWGSNRLEGFHAMKTNEPTWRYTMLQEFGHRFAASAKYKDPETKAIMTDHLLVERVGHWRKKLLFSAVMPEELDDDKSPMDYGTYDWIEQENGQFVQQHLESDERTYCNLDLYLMGLMGPDEVGEITMLRNITKVPDPTSPAYTATPVRLTIENFIEVPGQGERVPNVHDSPKHWRQAFIVLTNDMANVHDFVERVDALRVRWERKDFPEGTQGRASVDTTLDRAASNFTIIFRQEQFGNEPHSLDSIERFVHFAGPTKDFIFSCPRLDPRESALLQFQSRGVNFNKNIISINGRNLSEGIPVNATTSVGGVPINTNPSNSNVLFLRPGTLRSTGNVLHIEARNPDGGTNGNIDDFILDNMVVMYKTR